MIVPGRKGRLMAAMTALIPLVATTVDNSIVFAVTEWATETVRPAHLFQCCLPLLLGGLESVELRKGKTVLEWDGVLAMRGLV